MGARILAHPFRLLPNGTVATVEQGSDEANAQQLAVLCTTLLGERPLEPGFGILDPTFSELHPSELLAGVLAYGPDVEIVDVRSEFETSSTQIISIDFQ